MTLYINMKQKTFLLIYSEILLEWKIAFWNEEREQRVTWKKNETVIFETREE